MRIDWKVVVVVGVTCGASLLTGCAPECLDMFDCRELEQKEGRRYTCIQSKCAPITDTGTGGGGGELGGGAGGGGGAEDAGAGGGSGGGTEDAGTGGGSGGGIEDAGTGGGSGGGTEDAGTGGGSGGGTEDAGTGGGSGGDEDAGTGGGSGSNEDAGTGGGSGSDEDAGTGGGSGSDEDAGTGGGSGSDEDAGTGGGPGSGQDAGTDGGTDDAGTPDAGAPDTSTAVAILVPQEGALIADAGLDLVGSGEALATVSVFNIDGGALCATTVATDGGWSCFASLSDGLYTVTAHATDSASNEADSVAVSFTIDTTAPALTLEVPADGSWLDAGTVALSGAIDGGVQVVAGVTGGALSQSTPCDPAPSIVDGAWSCVVTGLSDGDYVATATGSDLAGNSSSSTSSFTVDTLPPDAGVEPQPAFTNDTTPTFNGLAEPGARVQVALTSSSSSAPGCDTVADQGGFWSCTAVALPSPTAGTDYTASVTAIDHAGNVSAPATTSFVLDTVAPNAGVIVSPADNAQLTTTAITFSGTAEPYATVTLELDGSLASAEADINGDWTFGELTLGQGDHQLFVTVTDRAGNVSAPSPATSFLVDSVPPAVTISSPDDNTWVLSGPVVVSGSYDGAPLAGLTIHGEDGGVLCASATIESDTGWSCALDSALPDGRYVITARATDTAGNVGDSAPVTFTMETSIPEIAWSAPANGSVFADAGVDLSGTISTDVTSVSVVDGAGQVICGPVALSGVTAWTCSATLPDGVYALTAVATDGPGRVVEAGPVTVTIDTMAPAAPVITPPAAVSDTSAIVFSGACDTETVLVRVYIEGAPGVACSATLTAGTASWNCGVGPHAEGSLTVRATATDSAGNESPLSAAVTQLVQNQPTSIDDKLDYLQDQADTSDGGDVPVYELLISGVVTAVKPLVPDAGADDGPGFFLMGSPDSGAFFVVNADGGVFNAGDTVDLLVTAVRKGAHGRQISRTASLEVTGALTNLGDYVRATDFSGLDLDRVALTLFTFDAGVLRDPQWSGSGYLAASLSGRADGGLELRGPEALLRNTHLGAGCTVSVGPAPLWREWGIAQPSVWQDQDFTVTSCPPPALYDAEPLGSTHLLVRFTRDLDPTTIQTGDFTLVGVAENYPHSITQVEIISPRELRLVLGYMGPDTFTLTVNGVSDLRGTPIPPGSTVTFTRPAGSGSSCDLPEVIISQVYANGGRPDSPYDCDFVELHNRRGADVTINGWTIQYSTHQSPFRVLAQLPAITMHAGEFYVVGLGVGCTGASYDLTIADTLDDTTGRVLLVPSATPVTVCPRGTPLVADMMGYGLYADCHTPVGDVGTPVPAPAGSGLALMRKGTSSTSLACIDTNSNLSDWEAGPAQPRDSTQFSFCNGYCPP